MVAPQFLNLVGKLHLTTYVGVEDFTDKLNFLFTIAILILSMMVVTIKSYFLKPITCFISTNPGGNNFDIYMEDYCWVHGVIPRTFAHVKMFQDHERISEL